MCERACEKSKDRGQYQDTSRDTETKHQALARLLSVLLLLVIRVDHWLHQMHQPATTSVHAHPQVEQACGRVVSVVPRLSARTKAQTHTLFQKHDTTGLCIARHTATYYIKLQHTATRCRLMQREACSYAYCMSMHTRTHIARTPLARMDPHCSQHVYAPTHVYPRIALTTLLSTSSPPSRYRALSASAGTSHIKSAPGSPKEMIRSMPQGAF